MRSAGVAVLDYGAPKPSVVCVLYGGSREDAPHDVVSAAVGIIGNEYRSRRRYRPLEGHISLGAQTMTGLALLKQTSDTVTGSIGPDERIQHPLDGVVKGNRITLTTHPRPGATVAFEKCYLTGDGEKMTGTTEGGDLRDKATIELTKTKE